MKRVLPSFSPLVAEARYCHVRPLRGPSAGVLVACAGGERCLPQYRVSRPEFACWGFEFIAEGEGSVELAGRKYPLRPGCAFMYGPGVSHEIRTDPHRPMFKYFVDFFGKAAKSFMDDLGLRIGEVRRVVEPDSVRFLFDELIREGQKTTPRRHDAADAYLRLLLHKAAEIPATAGAAPSVAYATWQRCRSVLDERFREIKGLSELSRIIRVDPSHLCRIFKRYGAVTPHAELTRRKLNQAAMLLLTTSELVKTVASQVGFDDPLHFSRVFQRQFGCSPVAFRESEARRKTES